MPSLETKSKKKFQERKLKTSNPPATSSGSIIRGVHSKTENFIERNKYGLASSKSRLPVRKGVIRNAVVSATTTLSGNEAELTSSDIFVKENSCLKKISTKDIYLIEGLCDSINIYAKEKRYSIYSTMYSILERLPKKDFMRVHRSYIVRIDSVSSIIDNQISVDMKRIPVSKTYKKEVVARLRTN